MGTVIVTLPIHDEDGHECDTATAILDDEQATMLVARAVELAYEIRKGVTATDESDGKDTAEAMMELDDLLVELSLIEPGDYFPGQ